MVSLNDMHPFSLMFSEDISHKGTPPSTSRLSARSARRATHSLALRVATGLTSHTWRCVALCCVCSARVAVCGVRDRLRSNRGVHLDVRGQLPARERLQDVAWYPQNYTSDHLQLTTTIVLILTNDDLSLATFFFFVVCVQAFRLSCRTPSSSRRPWCSCSPGRLRRRR